MIVHVCHEFYTHTLTFIILGIGLFSSTTIMTIRSLCSWKEKLPRGELFSYTGPFWELSEILANDHSALDARRWIPGIHWMRTESDRFGICQPDFVSQDHCNFRQLPVKWLLEWTILLMNLFHVTCCTWYRHETWDTAEDNWWNQRKSLWT